MRRREALRNVALLVGGGMLSATTLSIVLNGCTAASKKGNKHLFSDEQQTLITELADVIIPTTSCPGAKAAGVGTFITMMIKDCYPINIQQDFIKGLNDFSTAVKNQFGKAFVSLSPQDQIKAVTQLRDRALAEQKAKQDTNNFFVLARDLTILGYFTSEIGATQATAYLAVPGRYDGDVDLKPGQKLWAVN